MLRRYVPVKKDSTCYNLDITCECLTNRSSGSKVMTIPNCIDDSVYKVNVS